MDTKPGTKPPRKRFKASEEKYEMLPREAEWKEEGSGATSGKIHYRLPLKTREGLVLQEPVTIEEKEEVEEEEEEEVEEVNEDDFDAVSDEECQLSDDEELKMEVVPPVLSTAQLLAQRDRKLKKKKEQIATIASQIIEDPQANVRGLVTCLIRDFESPDIALSVRKLAMISLMTVYKDIIPSYRIRELSVTEKATKVSKDVLKLRKYEQNLIKYYDGFIGLLEAFVQSGLNDFKNRKRKLLTSTVDIEKLESGLNISKSGLEGLGETALKCLCDLGIFLNHFNSHIKIFTIIVQQLVSSESDEITRMCHHTISKTFASDIIGEISLEIVRIITQIVKSRGYHIKPEVLKTFLSLNLYHVTEPVGQYGHIERTKQQVQQEKRRAKLEKQRMSRKQRRKVTARNRLEKELREAEAEERAEKKSKLQTETIKLVFWTYFRVLKYAQDSPLLGAVLEGLAKFSHLISVDYFTDLMSVLSSLMDKQTLSSQQTIQCILTAFQILSGQGESLNIDPRQFYCQFFVQLLQLDHKTDQYNMSLVLNCLEKITKQKKNISNKTVIGFFKRVATMCLQLPSSNCLGIMGTLRSFLQSYRSQCEALLENDEDGVSSLFQPDVPDPELSGAGLLWELATLKKHYDPYISSYSQHLLKGAPSQGAGSLQLDFSRKSNVELMEINIWPNTNPFTNLPLKPAKKK